MAKMKFNQSGDLINAQTGQVLGNIRSGINFNSYSSELKTLQQTGCSLPQISNQQLQNNDNVVNDNVVNDNAVNDNKQEEKQLIIDKGLSSFKKHKSKYEISKDTYFIIRFGLYRMEQDDRFIPIHYDSISQVKQAQSHWVKFRMWNFREELKWKQQSTQYHAQSHSQIINNEKLNEKKIRQLMLDWSFGQYDDKLKLLHCDGVLSDESYSLFLNMYPSIANTIINLMNSVLENNQ